MATKGAEDVAGSAPSFLSKIGNIEPLNEPQSTTKTNETLMVNAINNQCSPYVFGQATCQRKIRRKPIKPRQKPKRKPDVSSRSEERRVGKECPV